jgi:S-adenosylmethionine:tRNA ribosyltransferase-isomerase
MDRAADFRFDLPPELVAQEPLPRRSDSQLMLLRAGQTRTTIQPFSALPELLQPGDLLVANDSRVLAARLLTRRVDTGGQVEILLLAPAPAPALGGAWQALARPARRLRPSLRLVVTDPDGGHETGVRLQIVACGEQGQVVVAGDPDQDLALVAERHGEAPLPPYIRRARAAAGAAERRRLDRERYQTVYARPAAGGAGSAAAPTAGLHFDPPVLARLAARGVDLATVTLHVGLGTFRPPSPEQIAAGRLHAESFHLPARTAAAVAACRRRGGRVVAVGTTSLRVLATVHDLQLAGGAPAGARREFGAAAVRDADGVPPVFTGHAVREETGWSVRGTTRLFIQPPARIAAADALLTNFHLPGSSLLRLVAAMAGEATWRAAYAEAVARRLRFFSYGDAMLILPAMSEESA